MEVKGDMLSYTDEDFKIEENLSSEVIQSISDSLIQPGRISIVDEYLLISDFKAGKPLHILNLKNQNHLGSYGVKGQGPGEVATPWSFSELTSKKFTLVDIVQKKILEYDIDTLLRFNRPVYEQKLNQNGFTQFAKVYGDTIFFDDGYKLNYRLYKSKFYDVKNTSSINGYGEIPIIVDAEISDIVKRDMTMAHMKSKNGFFVFVYMYCPRIEIFDYGKKQWKTIISPKNFVPEFNKSVQKGFTVTKKTVYAYPDIALTDKYIYALYSEKRIMDHVYPKSNSIYVFDFEGNPIKKYNLDKDISFFSVKNDSTIYATNVETNPELVVFSLY